MKATKLIALGLATGLMVSGSVLSGATAFAQGANVTPNGDGTSTIDTSHADSTTTVDTSAEIPTKGFLGFNNTVNPPVDPDEPDLFVNVTFPTEAAYYTTDSSDHVDIVSVKHTVTNNSARPVRVDVTNFDISGTAVVGDFDNLKVTADKTADGTGTDVPGTPVDLITQTGLANFTTPQTLMTLDSPLADSPSATLPDTFKGTSTADYSFSGKTEGDFTTQSKEADSTMTLDFTPLQPDGSEYPAP
jgi:hypothetical protein